MRCAAGRREFLAGNTQPIGPLRGIAFQHPQTELREPRLRVQTFQHGPVQPLRLWPPNSNNCAPPVRRRAPVPSTPCVSGAPPAGRPAAPRNLHRRAPRSGNPCPAPDPDGSGAIADGRRRDVDGDRALHIGPRVEPTKWIAGAQLELADARHAALRNAARSLRWSRFPRRQRCRYRRRSCSEPRCRADRRWIHCAARTRASLRARQRHRLPWSHRRTAAAYCGCNDAWSPGPCWTSETQRPMLDCCCS